MSEAVTLIIGGIMLMTSMLWVLAPSMFPRDFSEEQRNTRIGIFPILIFLIAGGMVVVGFLMAVTSLFT